mgnify:FL=1
MSNFARYDYGSTENVKRYGISSAPPYMLANIPPLDMMLITGMRDALADAIDVTRLIVELHGGVKVYTDPLFGHLDFIFADSANTRVYGEILSFLQT